MLPEPVTEDAAVFPVPISDGLDTIQVVQVVPSDPEATAFVWVVVVVVDTPKLSVEVSKLAAGELVMPVPVVPGGE